MRLIDADKFLDLLKNSSEGFWRKKQMVNGEPLSEAMSYEMNTIRKCVADANAKAEYAPKWVKVEDGLPETHLDSRLIRERSDEVMCKIKDGEDVFNSCGYLIEHTDGHKEWRTDCYMTDDGEVIAWMPIPKYEVAE